MSRRVRISRPSLSTRSRPRSLAPGLPLAWRQDRGRTLVERTRRPTLTWREGKAGIRSFFKCVRACVHTHMRAPQARPAPRALPTKQKHPAPPPPPSNSCLGLFPPDGLEFARSAQAAAVIGGGGASAPPASPGSASLALVERRDDRAPEAEPRVGKPGGDLPGNGGGDM